MPDFKRYCNKWMHPAWSLYCTTVQPALYWGQGPIEHCMHLKVPPCTRCSMLVGHVMWNTSGDSLTGSHGGHQPENREIGTVQWHSCSQQTCWALVRHIYLQSVKWPAEWQGCWSLFLTLTVPRSIPNTKFHEFINEMCTNKKETQPPHIIHFMCFVWWIWKK
jgi:hypothetical protein